jgi:hypothetical protein
MRTMEGSEPFGHWDALVPHVVHPLKVIVIEVIGWVGQPLSSSEITKVLDDSEEFPLSNVSYHVRRLAETGVIEAVRERRVRGAVETFYFFPPWN